MRFSSGAGTNPGAWRWPTNGPTLPTVPLLWSYYASPIRNTDLQHRPNCATTITGGFTGPNGNRAGYPVTGIQPPPKMVTIAGGPSGLLRPSLPRLVFPTPQNLPQLSYMHASTYMAQQQPTLPPPHTPPLSIPFPKSRHIHPSPPSIILHFVPDELGDLLVPILAYCGRNGFFRTCLHTRVRTDILSLEP